MFLNIVQRLVVITTNNNLAVRYVWLIYLKLQDKVFFPFLNRVKRLYLSYRLGWPTRKSRDGKNSWAT